MFLILLDNSDMKKTLVEKRRGLFTWYEWKSHFSSCLWKCPICGKSFKHASEISVHKMHHVRREAKLARLEEED